jgi:hypothetical protein
MTPKVKTTIGWAEWVQMPQIGLPFIKAKSDTGARTSALHAFNIEPFSYKGAPWVRFKIHPLQGNNTVTVTCEAPVIDRRAVTDSGGKSEKRLVIETFATVGDITRAIEITLTNRERMAFRMLLGRQAMERFGFIVDPAHATLLMKLKQSSALAAYKKMKSGLMIPKEFIAKDAKK